LNEVAVELSRRLIHIFLRDQSRGHHVLGDNAMFQDNPLWRDVIPSYEYFHGDNGTGIGANPQTGWTELVAQLIQPSGG
jgi:hypothetical protein